MQRHPFFYCFIQLPSDNVLCVALFFSQPECLRQCHLDMKVGESYILPAVQAEGRPVGRRKFSTGDTLSTVSTFI